MVREINDMRHASLDKEAERHDSTLSGLQEQYEKRFDLYHSQNEFVTDSLRDAYLVDMDIQQFLDGQEEAGMEYLSKFDVSDYEKKVAYPQEPDYGQWPKPPAHYLNQEYKKDKKREPRMATEIEVADPYLVEHHGEPMYDDDHYDDVTHYDDGEDYYGDDYYGDYADYDDYYGDDYYGGDYGDDYGDYDDYYGGEYY